MVYYTLHINKLLIVFLLSILSNGVIYSGNLSRELNEQKAKYESDKRDERLIENPNIYDFISSSFGYSHNIDNSACIKEINVGVNIDLYKGKENLRGKSVWTKFNAGLQALSFGLSYKQYNDFGKSGVLNFNAVLLKVQGQVTHMSDMSGLMRQFDIAFIEKKTPIYASTSIDWVSINLGLGYDPFYSSEFTRIAIIPRLGLGFRNLILDTNIFTELPNNKKEKTHYGFVSASALFLASHKALNLYADIAFIPYNSLFHINYKAGISYTFWRKIKDFSLNDCSIFLNFETNKFSISDDTGTFSKTIQNIRGGLSFRLAAFFDTAY